MSPDSWLSRWRKRTKRLHFRDRQPPWPIAGGRRSSCPSRLHGSSSPKPWQARRAWSTRSTILRSRWLSKRR
ncbi:unnamed protein product [Symbiodinium sp. KB8]|nr:unnamed protein product [Symbiodinium sp. KB8]